MEIQILHMIEGAKAARGITVIIDVFRAFTTESCLLARGAECVIPVGDAELARRLKEEDPTRVLAGERGGRMLPGFDMGNSPAQAEHLEVMGKTVVHTTSAGTQGIANASGADEILGGSLVTARATANYILSQNPAVVSLVAMGLDATSETEEDTLCANYLAALLRGEEPDITGEIAALRHTSGAKFFDPAQQDVFPEADFHIATDLNRFDFAIRLENRRDGLSRMRLVR
ncbi:MAG: 2-phosphosulfolactate phosphatase [Clostridia bacterium]|nr:2-phosphosulfolactate phosphatase [Clostridia bacterium]